MQSSGNDLMVMWAEIGCHAQVDTPTIQRVYNAAPVVHVTPAVVAPNRQSLQLGHATLSRTDRMTLKK